MMQKPAHIEIEGDSDEGAAWLVAAHESYYAREWRFGDFFRDKVAADLADLRAELPHEDCAIWFARSGGRIVGSIAIDGRHAATTGAHLRWFMAGDGARGTGVGAMLIDAALVFCRAREFASVYLWTFAGLDAARRMYEKRGFLLEEEIEDETWGVRVREQKFRLVLKP